MKFMYLSLAMLITLPLIYLIENFVVFLSSKGYLGVSGIFELILYIISMFIFLFLFIYVIGFFVGEIRRERLQRTLPVITDNAKVISKHTKITGRQAYTCFYVAFELESGERKLFEVTNEQYSFLVEEESGELYYKEGKGFAFFVYFKVN